MAETKSVKSSRGRDKKEWNYFIVINVVVFIILASVLLVDHFIYQSESQPATLSYLRNTSFIIFFMQLILMVTILSGYIQKQGGVVWWLWVVYALYLVSILFWISYFMYYEAPDGKPPKELWWTKTGVSIYVSLVTLATLLFFLRK